MTTKAAALSLLATALLAGAVQAAPTPKNSWGKPGVSYLKYRTDAAECLHYVETQAPVKLPLVDVVFEMDMAVSPDGGLDAMYAYADQQKMHMNRNWREVRRQATGAVETCLAGRGYSRFKLTKAEREELEGLRVGTPARQLYLWRLGSEPR
ncbi:hypothetical protein AS593_09335 [Caulobacter vibrioides]|nr:hypothetical protein AS593_09335 [Caulobacter vibrioides]